MVDIDFRPTGGFKATSQAVREVNSDKRAVGKSPALGAPFDAATPQPDDLYAKTTADLFDPKNWWGS